MENKEITGGGKFVAIGTDGGDKPDALVAVGSKVGDGLEAFDEAEIQWNQPTF